MAKLRGGTTIGGFLATNYDNFKSMLKNLTYVSLTGDVIGSTTFDSDGDLSMTTIVVNDSHSHSTSTITNLSGTNTGDNSGVTSVSGTAPVVSSGGTTPAISIPAATASVSGYATSTQITKLDGIATSANNYILPVASTTIGGVKSGTDITVDGSGNVTLNIIDGGEI